MARNLKIVIIIAIIALAGFGGYLIINNKADSSSSGVVNTNTPKIMIWKAYDNEKHGYQLDYPAWYANLANDSTDDVATFSSDDQYWYLIVNISNSEFTTIDEWLAKNIDKTLVEKREVGGYDAIITKYANEEGYSQSDRVAVFIKDKQIFILQSRINLSDLTKLLDSFRFENK